MQKPRSDEEIRKLIGEEPSWPRRTDTRVSNIFVYAACIAAVLAAVSIGIALQFNRLSLITIALLLGLTYGIFKKSRLCSIGLFICGALLTASSLAGKIPGLEHFPIGFLVIFFLGMIGTLAIKKSKHKRAN